MTRRRCIVVVTEGASWPLVRQWSADGHLPGFRRLFASGTAGRLVSGPVPYEVPGITSMVTGRRPGDHGFFSFWAAQNPGYAPRVLEPRELAAPPIWRRPECADRKFALVNVFGTHPPEPINGWVLSYAMSQTLRSSYPRELALELAARDIRYPQEVSVWYAGQPRDAFVAQICDVDRRRALAALELWQRGADVVFLVLTSLDRAGHHYWQELEPGSPFATRDTAMFAAFTTCDRIIARLLERVDDHTSVIAASEQGFGPNRAYLSINRELARAGLLAYREPGDEPADEHAIDWARTRAFEAVQGTHGVNLNLVGRNQHGLVAPGDHAAVRDEVAACLRAAINPHTGLPMFRAVQPREAVHAGAAVDRAPDLVVEPLDERYPPLGDPLWAGRVHRRWHSGWHRRESYFAAVGPAFRAGAEVDGVAPEDVAASVYHACGLAIPDDFAGQVRA
ncbi:MAG TPA: alkaline phosphatase family protein [Kofleriaceae bacterium]|jgi:predicted AlkP superfamily phosphohydrolase/phosphomutase|nr:alkaline phosphatase family protein [Kofleriaceae bacterium]